MKGLDGGVPEPFLRAGAVLSRSMFLANQAAQLVSVFLHPRPYDASSAARLLPGGDEGKVIFCDQFDIYNSKPYFWLKLSRK